MEENSFYNNFFVGIPLSDKVHKEYKIFLDLVNKKFPYLKVTKTKFPHITVSFLGKQPKERVEVIKCEVEGAINILDNTQVIISGFDYFKNTHAHVLYLKVKSNPKLQKFHKDLSQNIEDIFETKWHDFIPHLTIARVKDEDKNKFKKDLPEINKEFNKPEFRFNLREIDLFGRDPDKKNKLFKIDSVSTF